MRQPPGIQADGTDAGVTIVDDESFPRLLELIAVVVPMVIGAGAVVVAPSETRTTVAAIIGVAVAPWILRQFVARWSLGWPLVTVAAVAALHLGRDGEAWILDEAVSEVSMLLLVWVVVDDAVSREHIGARVSFAAAALLLLARGFRYSGVYHQAYLGSTSIWLGGLLLAHLGGRLLHHFALNVARLRSTQLQLAGEAVASEQRRIAREVHDVVAHSLSVTALHLSAARMALDRGDVEAGSAALTDAEQLNRSSLADLRRTVRLLRPAGSTERSTLGSGAGTDLALPGIGAIDELVLSFAGVVADLTVSIDPRTAGVDDLRSLTAYRIVQESLTNAVRHQVSPRVAVSVDAVDDRVVVEVRSAGVLRPQTGAGIGLEGMRERVEGLDGTVEAGPSDDGWSVRATLPCPRSASVPVAPHPDCPAPAWCPGHHDEGPAPVWCPLHELTGTQAAPSQQPAVGAIGRTHVSEPAPRPASSRPAAP